MATPSAPILIYQPGGGTPIFTPGPPQVGHAAPEHGVTYLIAGQSYVDVVFVTTQPRSDWTFVELQVVNLGDSTPLNIWPGIVTVKSRNGFRLYLNGVPDTGNYYLDWSINGGTVADAGTAATYTLSGPDSGPKGVATSFTVALPMGTTVDIPVTVTPDDGGAGGVFSPSTVGLTTDAPSANFTYTPSTYGARTISVTNDQFLIDPGSLSFTSVVVTYTLSGPSAGASGTASTNFTVALPVGGVTLSTITVTPNDAGVGTAGTFTPATVNLTTAAPSATFTYTPASTGAKTISVTNNRGLTNPANLTYTVSLAQHLLNTLISYWKLDEASAGSSPVTRVDSQGSNNLTDINNVSSNPGGLFGNNSVHFDSAATQHLEHASNASLQVTGDFTFSFWVYMITTGSYAFISKADFTGGGIDYELGYDATNGFFFMAHYSGASTDIVYAGAGAAATLYHVVGWWDSATSRANIRVNDAATFTATTGAALTQTATPFWVGARPASGAPAYTNGVIDEVGFWKRKLTAAEITFLYNAGAGNPYSSFLA